MRSRIVEQRTDQRAGRECLARPLVGQFGYAGSLDQAAGPAALLRAEVPAHGHVVQARDPPAGQPQVEVILVLAHRVGRIEGPQLMFLEPQRLRDHPFRRHRAAPVAVDAQRRIARRRDALRLLLRAHVHPDERRAQRLALRVEHHHGAAGRIERERRDRTRVDPCGLHALADRLAERDPPVLRLLLGPARLGKARLVRRRGERERRAREVEEARAQSLGAAIDTQHIASLHLSAPRPGRGRDTPWPSRARSSRGRCRRRPRRCGCSGSAP